MWTNYRTNRINRPKNQILIRTIREAVILRIKLMKLLNMLMLRESLCANLDFSCLFVLLLYVKRERERFFLYQAFEV